jgi:hypothetical protein
MFPVTDLRRPTTEYGLRDGWHLDPDGNLLRFGSPIPSEE